MATANFELTESSYVDTFWFVGSPTVPADWLAMIYRDTPEAPWRLTYRFRYHNPESEGRDVHDHKDRFSTTHLTSTGEQARSEWQRDKLVQATDRMAAMVPFGPVTRLDIKGNADRFHEIMSTQPFFNSKVEKLDDQT